MYPEDDTGDLPQATNGGIKSKVSYHLEGLIPLIIIIIIIALVGSRLGFWDLGIPGLTQDESKQLLIIGNPSFDTRYVLDQSKDLVTYRIRSAESMEVNPEAQLANYDIVMLDQSTQANKEISRQLGAGIESWVKKGGKFILVKDSGIRRKGAADVVGWQATFGDIVPVVCDRTINDQPSCTVPLSVTGRIYRQDFKHQIMKGIDVAPAEQETAYLLQTFEVTPVGRELAYIQSANNPQFYTALVEKELIIGKSIYFNYDPGISAGILQATLKYLS
jgi:hypothetical protein